MSSFADHLILIIESDMAVADKFASYLCPPYHVEVAGTAAKAITRIRDAEAEQVDAILLDLVLPNGRGLTLIRQFAAAFPDVPLIVISDYEYEPDDVIKAGAQDYMHKPCSAMTPAGHNCPLVPPEMLRELVHKTIIRHDARKLFQPIRDELAAAKAGEKP